MSSEAALLSALEGGKPSPPPNRRVGLIVAGVAGGLGIAVTLAAIPFVSPALRRVCIPYVPATPNQLANVTRALGRTGLNPKELSPLIDLGSGDGRVVLECAKMGITSSGVELNSILVAYSKWSGFSSRSSLAAPVSFRRKDIFKTDVAAYKTAVIFGAESLMGDLVPKLGEMREGSRLLACRFPLPDNEEWKMIEQIGEGIDAVWVYSRK
ncbi:hypothetical protein PFISCL1PPCAC_10663 [Pristionchus fissidentatus]|uniref:ATP synthase subunit C lysine N-methyltransferase n=1 Tax=Pristionchus fissidentatus TaxID=1538716 RepID=A0AAV5VIC8_9BILA|nr:hypothetical protein PFISCL1PPCAC_10663 [Pristionchus fissidentatus]